MKIKSRKWMAISAIVASALLVISFQGCTQDGLRALSAAGNSRSTVLQEFSAVIAWDKVDSPSLTGYKIYLGESSGVYARTLDAGLSADPDAPQYTVNGLDQNVRYFAVVKAYDSSGAESPASNEIVISAK